jgi:aminoglycoside phosphotransferase
MLNPNPRSALAWIHEKLDLAGEGYPAIRPDLHGDLPRLAVIMGEALASLHAVEVADAPLPSGWNRISECISQRLAANEIDPAHLGKPYDLYAAERLVEIWQESQPPSEDLVVCCGRPTLEDVLIKDSALAGFTDARYAMVADRHLDLAVAQQSIHAELGSEAVFAFYEGYGLDANIVKLDHYILASRLLGIVS